MNVVDVRTGRAYINYFFHLAYKKCMYTMKLYVTTLGGPACPLSGVGVR